MGNRKKLARHLISSKIKRINNIKIHFKGFIAQRTKIQNGGNVKYVEEEKINVEDLNESHLEQALLFLYSLLCGYRWYL
jgi:hypothetical protein